MKSLCDAAEKLNEEIIAKHNYTKFNAHLDYFKLSSIDGFLDIDDYYKLGRKYTAGQGCDPVWAVRVRLVGCKRLEDLKEYDAQKKHLRHIASILDHGKYKTIPFGPYLNYSFAIKKV